MQQTGTYNYYIYVINNIHINNKYEMIMIMTLLSHYAVQEILKYL